MKLKIGDKVRATTEGCYTFGYEGIITKFQGDNVDVKITKANNKEKIDKIIVFYKDELELINTKVEFKVGDGVMNSLGTLGTVKSVLGSGTDILVRYQSEKKAREVWHCPHELQKVNVLKTENQKIKERAETISNIIEKQVKKMTSAKNGLDMVNNPKHYTSHPSGIECIEITQHMGFILGSALKYLWRADLKENALQDLEKAVWYINKEIEIRKTKQKENK